MVPTTRHTNLLVIKPTRKNVYYQSHCHRQPHIAYQMPALSQSLQVRSLSDILWMEPSPERNKDPKSKRAYKQAKWDNIGRQVQEGMIPKPTILSETDLDATAKRLIQTTSTALGQHIPNQKSSPYSKRLFTLELKVQQAEVNQARRRWQDSCATKVKSLQVWPDWQSCLLRKPIVRSLNWIMRRGKSCGEP